MATETKTKKHRSSQSTPDHYVLRVELMGIQPSIWRRIHLDGRTRLDALHHILQAAMGWSDSHLHKFEIRGKHYGVPDPEFTDPGWEVLDEKKYRLNQLLAEGDTCDYLYDFGDSWMHHITVEAIKEVKPTPSDGGFAWVEVGERACPPDDAGGSGGYQDFLDRLNDDRLRRRNQVLPGVGRTGFRSGALRSSGRECHHQSHALEPLDQDRPLIGSQPSQTRPALVSVPQGNHFPHAVGLACDLDRVPDDEQQALGRELDLIIAGERQAIEHRFVGCAEAALDD